jgi:hypothetical protein
MINLPIESGIQAPLPTIRQRIIGGAFFGLLVGAYAQNAAAYTLPAIISYVQGTDLETAKEIYDDSSFYRTLVIIIFTFLGGVAAGLLARRRGTLAGILSSSPYIFAAGYILIALVGPQYAPIFSKLPFAADMAGDTSIASQILLRLILIALAGSFGGFIGQKLYAPAIDLDLGQTKVTVFGVRWAHYFWILPVIYVAFLASVLMIIYAGITVIFADISFAWHPSLWFNFAWNWGFPVGLILVWLAAWITGVSFVRFYSLMQYGQTSLRGWKRVGLVILCGVGAPTLTYTLAALGADVARVMPKPAEGDWKIAVGILVAIMAVRAIASIISHIREGYSKSHL